MNIRHKLSQIVVVAVILFLLFFIVSGLIPSTASSEETDPGPLTHQVFAEFGTATWCGFCKYAHAALRNLYAGGSYPFYFVSLVRDVNEHAADRILHDYNISGYPTVFFDGGYRVVVGAGSVPGAEAEYIAAINACGARPVPDIEVSLSFTWLGDATMDVRVSVQNNDTSDYWGSIRVYVTEISSTMGWHDLWGYPYTFAFLDYAFDQNILVDAGDTWQDSTIWNGNEHNDGYGHDFGDITLGNVMVIAAVFNGEWHPGYADPPDQNPFYAYYLDDVTGLWVNVPPYTPGDPTPEDESMGVKVDVDLSWTGGDVNIFDPPTYDVYFGTSSPP